VGLEERKVLMRNLSVVASGLLLCAAMFTSCTCQKQVGAPPPLTERKVSGGFPAALPKGTPPAQAQKPEPTLPFEEPQRAEVEPETPVELPEDFPADVPIFEGAKVSRVFGLANNAQNVIFSTTAPVSDVTKFYRRQMQGSGWEIKQQFQRGNHAFTTFRKGNLIANVTVAEDARNPGNQVIAIMYEEEQPLEFDEF
jgi:hypothetical protein